MDIYHTEQEQIEAIKKFFKTNGTNLLLAIVVLLSGFFGYHAWVNNLQQSAEQSSILYSQLRTLTQAEAEITETNKAKFNEIFAQLMENHSASIYASYASLLKAKLNVESNELDKAAQALQWVIDAQASSEIVALANLRLARVTFASGDNEKALKILEAKAAPFDSAYAELRGDIYVELKKPEQALLAYKNSQDLKSGNESINDRVLEMKVNSLSNKDVSKVIEITPASTTDKVVNDKEN